MMDSSVDAAMDFNLLVEEDESGNDSRSRQDGDEEDNEGEGDNEEIELLEENQTREEEEEQEGQEEEHEEEEGNEEVREEQWRRPPPSKILTFPAHAPIQADTTTFSSREPTLLSVEDRDVDMEVTTEETPSPSTTPNRGSDSAGDHGKSPSIATPGGSSDDRPSSNSSEESSLQGHHKRFLELQAFLKLCDEADQKDLLEALRSLSAAARSGHAFNLEYRALMLSMEEGREMLRLKMLNVMGGRASPSQSQQDNGSTPLGTRLPAPGSVTDFSAC